MDMIRKDEHGNEKVIGKICDRCHYSVESPDRYGEMEEFLHIRFVAGYSSRVYYDGDVLEAHFCQYCVRHHLGPYLRLKPGHDDRHRSGPSDSLLDLLREDPDQVEKEKRRRPLSDVYRGQ